MCIRDRVLALAQTIHVEVVQGQPAGMVFADNRKSRACDHLPDAKPFCNIFCQCGFAGTQIADQGDDGIGPQALSLSLIHILS